MPKSVMWQERTFAELNELAAAGAIALLPVASMEQHGPHLPVGVDTILVTGVCRRAAEIAGERGTTVVVAPTLWCGMAEHHMAFGGTFTFDIPTYRAVLLAFLTSIERGGFSRCAIVNGHGGNVTALNAFLPDLARETSLRLYATTYFELAQPAVAPLLETQKGVLHACELETSLMMALAPDMVRTDRLAEAHGPHFGDSRAVLLPAWQKFRSLMEFTPSGVIGDARPSSREKGEACLAACAGALADKVCEASLWD